MSGQESYSATRPGLGKATGAEFLQPAVAQLLVFAHRLKYAVCRPAIQDVGRYDLRRSIVEP